MGTLPKARFPGPSGGPPLQAGLPGDGLRPVAWSLCTAVLSPQVPPLGTHSLRHVLEHLNPHLLFEMELWRVPMGSWKQEMRNPRVGLTQLAGFPPLSHLEPLGWPWGEGRPSRVS